MDRVYKVGIIGCGGISRMHANWYKGEPRTQLITAADISQSQLDKFAQEYQLQKLYTDYIEMLEKEKPDIVSICTWPKFHSEMTIEAAKQGVKGILCEKPMGENLAQADAMIQACNKYGTKLAIDHQLRFDPPFVAARNLIAEGTIGRLFRIHAVCGGGDLKDNATHTVDLMRFINQDIPVVWVVGQIERIGAPARFGLDSENFSLGYFKFENNVRGVIEVGDDTAPGYHHIYCYGAEGEIELSVPGGPSIRMRNKNTGGDWVKPDTVYEKGPIQDLMDCIEGNREHRSSGYQGRATHEVLMAIYQSSRKRIRVRLPLEEKESPLTLMIREGLV